MKTDKLPPSSPEDEIEQKLKDANTTIKLGIGVGALGMGGAALAGAVCPLCVVVAPALIGAGLIQKRRVKKGKRKTQNVGS